MSHEKSTIPERERVERRARTERSRGGISPHLVRTRRAALGWDGTLYLDAYGERGIAALGGEFPGGNRLTRFETGYLIVGACDAPDVRVVQGASGEVAVTLPPLGGFLRPSVPPEQLAGLRLVEAVPNPALMARSAKGPDGITYPTGEPMPESYFERVLKNVVFDRKAMFAKVVR